jgi:predicted RNase H-like nuclease
VTDHTHADQDEALNLDSSNQGAKANHWIGIDGCRGGWIIAWLQSDHPAQIHYTETLQPFLRKAPKQAIILIDMILYKAGDKSPRPFDRYAKSELGKWHSRVFPAPPQEALIAQDYLEVCQRSQSISGKKISKQCYNLFPKMREANDPAIPSEQMLEYHPEIAFKQLNGNSIVEPSKKTELGRSLRHKLIKHHLGHYPNAPIKPKAEKNPCPWQPDDLLDALALALVAQNGEYKDFYQALATSHAPSLKHIQVNENFSRA